ncbi:MAG: Phosphonate transporter phosphate-binding periplasmic component [Proteobacteria bacterium]|nr:Phosphonate transporter phosphate-binding periplasmic component [Pseudomonadota bacterium]
MNLQRLVTIFVSCVLAACAATFDVTRDFDPSVNFAKLHTFGWMPDAKTGSGDVLIETDTLLRQRVQDAVEQGLILHGYRKQLQEGTPPDFWVTFHAALKRKVEVVTYGGYYGYGWWGYPWGYMGGGMWPQAYTRDYDERVIVLDILDPATRKLLWRATARDTLDEDATPQEKAHRIGQAVRQMLAGFPPLPGK